MSYLTIQTPDNATGDVAAVYQEITGAFGSVPAILQVLSASPFQLRQQWEFIKYSVQNPRLSRELQACIRMTVSQRTACTYCVDMNAGMLVNLFGWTLDQVEATKTNPSQANLPAREQTLLLFVLKAVENSHSTTQADVNELRGLDYSDEDILDALAVGARMVAGDIIANALHVERDF